MTKLLRVNGVYCPPVLGLAGPAGVGKTTIAKKLVGQYMYRRRSFATPLKQMLCKVGVPYDFVHKHKSEEIPGLGVTSRHMLQTLGTDWGRDTINPNIWVYAAEQALEEARKKDPKYRAVFDDVRFDNEAQFIRDHGGLVISLGRPGVDQSPEFYSHESESGISAGLVHAHVHAEGVPYMLAGVEKQLAKL